MANKADEIIAAGAQIIWVLEYTGQFDDGTAETCYTFMSSKQTTRGICVGDSETQPNPLTFWNSPFSAQRGIDVIVDPRRMNVVFTAGHGTTAGNENLNGDDILAAVEEAVANLQSDVDICE